MFEITSENDLRIAHLIVHELEQEGRRAEHVVDLKREIRKYNKRESDRRFVAGEYDWKIVLITLPDWVDTIEDAEEWFENCEQIPTWSSPYDCTGNPFTTGHHCFRRNGRWYCYHMIGFDL